MPKPRARRCAPISAPASSVIARACRRDRPITPVRSRRPRANDPPKARTEMSHNHIDYTSRFAIDPAAAAAMGTDELRHNFHIEDLFQPGRISLTYTHYDRMIVGGAMPVGTALPLEAIKPTGTNGFLDRRELIAVNIGGAGTIEAGGQSFGLQARDMLYLGMGADTVSFASADKNDPAKFYLLSAPAHQAHPSRLIRLDDAK